MCHEAIESLNVPLNSNLTNVFLVDLFSFANSKSLGPNAYNSEKGEEYLEGVKAVTIGARLKEAKKFLTPSPNKY